MRTADLKVNFCGVKFQNPFCLSASPISNTAEMCLRAFEAGWGGIIYKTLNVESSFKIVMPSPRLHAFNHLSHRFEGLQNAEQISDRNLADNLADITKIKKQFPDRVLIVSIMGYSDADWRLLAKSAETAGADMLELNFSCPQMARKDAGHRIGQDFGLVEHFTSVCKKASSLPVIAKMTPNLTDMVPVALAAQRGGADAISAINTIRAITDIDLTSLTPQPNIAGRSGITGYSGPAVKPIALRFISELHNCRELKIPLSGIGGVETWIDALHFILLGASTVQVTTAVMRYGYRIIEDLVEGLSDFMIDHQHSSLESLQGLAAQRLVDPADFDVRHQVVAQINETKCIGCGQCYVACQDAANQAIHFDPHKRIASVNELRCVGCTLCQQICPVWDCISTKSIDTSKNKHAAIF